MIGLDSYNSKWDNFGAYIGTCAALSVLPLVLIPLIRSQFPGRV
jgi:hypothetical protein